MEKQQEEVKDWMVVLVLFACVFASAGFTYWMNLHVGQIGEWVATFSK